MNDKERWAYAILVIPMGEEGSIYNYSVRLFREIYGEHPKDVLKQTVNDNYQHIRREE